MAVKVAYAKGSNRVTLLANIKVATCVILEDLHLLFSQFSSMCGWMALCNSNSKHYSYTESNPFDP